MMERRNALTLPFNVDKDNLMESPFKISMTSLSPECGKFKRQVSWTEFSCKRRHSDPQHKNGSVMSDHRHASKITVEMSRKQPCLILTDVLKTERGKTYMERIKQSCAVENGGQVSSPRKESGRCREKPAVCTDRRSSQREARNAKNKSVSPKCSPKTPSITPSHRLRLKRRLQNAGDDVDKEEKDIEEVIIGKDCGEDYKFATEVVDCGLSVSWDPAEDPESCDEFSAATIKDKCTDSEREVQHSVKRKIKDAGSHCNGTSSPKRHRESVLRLTGEDGRDGGPAPTLVCQEDGEEEEDVDLESLDRSIVQFTVGADVPAEILLPINIANNLEAGDFLSSRRQSVLSSQDNTTSEPIVLSSDEEESCDVPQRCSPLAHSLVTVEDAVIQRQSQQDALTKEQETSDLQDMQVLHVVVEDLPRVAVSLVPSVDYSCMGVAFFSLFCGGYQGKSNGDIMVTEDKIIIPLKDTSEKVALMLNIERKELRRYSVWEQQELEAQELYFEDEEEPMPPSALFLCVSDTAAAAIHRDLHKLYVKHGAPPHIGKVSPFVLLTLRDPLEGMEGALLRSLLDIDCLNCLSDEKSIFHNDAVCDLDDIHAPVLSLDDSIKLIRRTGLDSHLLTLLGLESAEPTAFNTDEPPPLPETDKNATPLIRLEVNPQKETILEVEAPTAEGDAGTQLKPEEEQKEQKLEPPTEKKKKDGPTPVYTLCHRRTKGSYSVSLCKPDSSWIKYKHKGLAHRLIQFPPPPLKGGITVTMEDLQCLDSGQFLNDVIIDFYLKYLLHKASPAVTERSHIFSSFFYKQLTRRDNASEGSTSDSCQRQRRHQRVKTWTRHVDIFKKDFLFVPVNQEAHWYLVVICFPGLAEPKTEAWSGPNSQTEKNQSDTDKLPDQETTAQGPKSPNDDAETQPATSASNHSEQADAASEKTQEEPTKDAAPGPVSCTEKTYQEKTVCKRPCILIMDSLKRSLHERVFKLLRDYLESEWEVRRGSSREFGTDQMQSSHCQVPLQDNSSDCGLYLLQYVESFLKDPVVHFDLPLHLQRWFPRQQVRRKRDEIRDLVLNLYRHQNLESNR